MIRTAVALICAGLVAVLVFGLMAGWAAIWGFTQMDNQPPDPPWVPLWNIGRIGFVAGLLLLFIGSALGIGAWLHDRLRRRRDAA